MSRKYFYILLAICAAAALSALGGYFAQAVAMALDLRHWARAAMLDDPMLWWVLLLYAVLIAVPFVPGAEIGMALIILIGLPIVGPVYLATVAALILSFSVGRWVPARFLHPFFLRINPIGPPRPPVHAAMAPKRQTVLAQWLAYLLRHRCAALVILINTPGNSLLGGGGGIAMVAGASGLFTYRDFVPSALIAVAPVPLFVWATSWFI
jgi:hypothetical protein